MLQVRHNTFILCDFCNYCTIFCTKLQNLPIKHTYLTTAGARLRGRSQALQHRRQSRHHSHWPVHGGSLCRSRRHGGAHVVGPVEDEPRRLARVREEPHRRSGRARGEEVPRRILGLVRQPLVGPVPQVISGHSQGSREHARDEGRQPALEQPGMSHHFYISCLLYILYYIFVLILLDLLIKHTYDDQDWGASLGLSRSFATRFAARCRRKISAK